MTQLLAGDIGGTKTILRLVTTKGKGDYSTVSEANFVSADYQDLVPMVQEFILKAGARMPEIACFAIAGPVVENTARLTNLNWKLLDTARLETELGIKHVSLINDFAAVSYGVLALQENDLYTVQMGKPLKSSPIGVIGAGTGLGEGFLVPTPSGYEVFATEGGHTDFAPTSDLEMQLLENIRQRYNIGHVSVERVVSGQGIVAIYQFLRDANILPETPEIGDAIRQWETQETTTQNNIDPAATIAKAAIDKRDRLCEKTMTLFIEAYAAEAGNLALKLLPYKGLYIAGGIAAKILPLIKESRFLDVFQDKGRMQPLLQQVPIHIVLNPEVGLLGSILYAQQSQVKS
jgi:glucokinase